MRSASFLLVAVSIVSPAAGRPLAAQQALLSRADSLAQLGDTAGALALLDRAVRQDPRWAAAWHRRGMLALAKARPRWHAEGIVKQRGSIALMRAADSSLRLASRLEPDSGRYALDLGRYFLFGNMITLRKQAPAAAPVSWSSVPVSRTMGSLAVQVARFRAAGDSSELVIFADVPVRKLVGSVDVASGPVDVALTLYEDRARARWAARPSRRAAASA